SHIRLHLFDAIELVDFVVGGEKRRGHGWRRRHSGRRFLGRWGRGGGGFRNGFWRRLRRRLRRRGRRWRGWRRRDGFRNGLWRRLRRGLRRRGWWRRLGPGDFGLRLDRLDERAHDPAQLFR